MACCLRQIAVNTRLFPPSNIPRSKHTLDRFSFSVITEEIAEKMGRKVVLATCVLNQWAMDFTGNLERIRESKYAVVPFENWVRNELFSLCRRYQTVQGKGSTISSWTRTGGHVSDALYTPITWALYRSIDWLIARPTLYRWSFGCLIVWSIDWLIDWLLTGLLTYSLDWLIDWLVYSSMHSFSCLLSKLSRDSCLFFSMAFIGAMDAPIISWKATPFCTRGRFWRRSWRIRSAPTSSATLACKFRMFFLTTRTCPPFEFDWPVDRTC